MGKIVVWYRYVGGGLENMEYGMWLVSSFQFKVYFQSVFRIGISAYIVFILVSSQFCSNVMQALTVTRELRGAQLWNAKDYHMLVV